MGILFLNSIFFIIFPILIINQFMLHLPVEAIYVLVPGYEVNSLNPNSNLISAHGTFTLGFFNISSTESTYLGIWYTNKDTRVWIANRDNPMNNSTSGKLIIDESGTLKVISGTNTTLFYVSNGVGNSGINTSAVLEDSGNLVLHDVIHNRILWQSFDHPTDTLLPGMKLGYNPITGQNWTLTSWLTDQIPASGAFTMKLEPFQNSSQLIIYRRGKIYWTSGPWLYGEYFQNDYHFDYPRRGNINLTSIVSDASGSMYSVVETQEMLQLSSMGRVTIPSFVNPDSTQNYCYMSDQFAANITSGGCAFSAPECRFRGLSGDSFKVEHGFFVSGDIIQTNNSADISLSDCMETCWSDCTCKGFSSSNQNGTGCKTWRYLHYYVSDSSDSSQFGTFIPGYKPFKSKSWRLVSVASVLTALFCYVTIRKCILQARETERSRRDNYIHPLAISDSFNFGDVLEKGIKDVPDIKIFSLGAILTATDSFSIKNKLGEGGYGPVYKGKLFDGREIAVKRLSKTSGQGIKEFKSELILISKLQHTNLVRLYGCCIHQEEKMLIYEFMPNKSPDFFIFAKDKNETIDWRMRFNIIQGVAQGLLYLHKYSRMKVIHRDLKVSNVLLDKNMNPKIADFGMARIFQHSVTEAITNRVVGTYGYMAPEYAMEGTFSIKSDVFSFGVLILEIVSGKKNSKFHNIDRPLNLVGYAWELWKVKAELELKDEALGESFDLKQLLRTIHVGLLCVQENADDRPTILEAISMLNNEITDLPIPNQPAFFTGKHPLEVLDRNMPVSVNGLSITTMEAR